MRQLNYLEKLLEGVGTEWQALSDLVTLRRGELCQKGSCLKIQEYSLFIALKQQMME